MKWKRSKARGRDVIDIRGAEGGGGGSSGLGGLSLPGGMAGLGGGAGIVVVLVIVAIQVFGGGGSSGSGFSIDDVFNTGAQPPGVGEGAGLPEGEDPDAELFNFSDYVFNDAQKVWTESFKRDGDTYERAQLV